jgi:hypothetical protein
MAITLFTRRPTVVYLALRIKRLAPMVSLLDPASVLLFGQACKAAWIYLDGVRQLETAQDIADQQRLAGIEAAIRNLAVECQRFYGNASGARVLTLTQDAQSALAQMIAYDPIRTATFDIENTVLRIFQGARIQ